MSEDSGEGLVLVVDDDETVRDVVRRYLEVAGFAVAVAGDGHEALERCAAQPPDLIVLDVMMPGLGGLEVCGRLRRISEVPVVMLTALGEEEEDRIAGLRIGADDYVTKPFSPRELTLRVSSVLRRSRGPAPGASAPDLVDDDLRLVRSARHATLAGAPLALTAREFDLLAFFLTHPGIAYSRADLLDKVWGWQFGDQSTVTVHVRRLREKIEADPANPSRVVTVWGIGYRYDPRRS
ncbi:response regulator with CheY-like receiver domain and winged-helix DNA-binding domain [Saccharomonospora marina XMU15]|uniref:Response regulator with CheY-like receiver domain and winged-helix DNA-binding domain n=1 Tax=Saccharomonospora marina XMU15 TaxID=882083 RepID=H5WWX7_9PSEU|nr:response regulator transcription factor [Saccharomonospora marina]EHR52805.1 response regulator with CheY-like receiver domain and winged-helix DNA-binding domain [Saccharomonospora marina XMU15]